MHGRHRAEFECALEAVDQRFVVAHDRVLVGHEVLEAVDALLLHQRAHVAPHAVVPPRYRDVKGVVGRRLLGPAAPGLVRLHQRLLRIRNDEIHDGGGAAGQAGSGAAVEIVHRHRAHEGQLHVGVRVDAAGQHILAAGIDDLRVQWRFQLVRRWRLSCRLRTIHRL